MSKYEPTIVSEKFPSGKDVLTIGTDDGSGDEPSEMYLYAEDLPKLLKALARHAGVDTNNLGDPDELMKLMDLLA